MAKWITLCFLVICVAVIFLTIVDDADAARGRFRSRVRVGNRVRVRVRNSGYGGYSRYRSARYGGVRIRQRIRYQGSSRMYKGSYGLTRSTWKNAFLLGTIYHGPWYLRSRRYHTHPNRMPTICRNNYETDDNNTVYNLFYCPRFFEPDDFDYCCGPELREYCCKYFDSPGRTAGIVIGVLLLVVIIGIIVYCVCKKKSSQGGKVLNPFSKQQPAPAPTMTYAAPVQPPATAAGPPPGYPDAEGKPGLPPGEVNQGGMPYPPQTAGYPPPDGGMYPPPGGYGTGPPGYEAVPTEYPPQPPQPGVYPPPTGPGGYPPPTGPGGYPPPPGPGGYPPPQPPGY